MSIVAGIFGSGGGSCTKALAYDGFGNILKPGWASIQDDYELGFLMEKNPDCWNSYWKLRAEGYQPYAASKLLRETA